MKSLIAATLICILAIYANAEPQENDVKQFLAEKHFFVQYLTVQKRLFFGKGKASEICELAKIDRTSCETLFDFWETKALSNNFQFINSDSNFHADIALREKNQDKKIEIIKEAQNHRFYAFCSYYYDHWGEINKMVDDMLANSKAQQNPTK